MSKTIESLKKIPSKEYLLHEHIADTYFYQKTRKRVIKHAAKNIRAALLSSLLLLIISLSIAVLAVLHNHYIKFLKEKTANSKMIKIFDAGSVNKEILKKFEFRGYAKAKSKISNGSIIINNLKKYNWADASFDFKFPIDLSNRNLSLTLRGKIGGERLKLILRDSNNRSYRLRDIYLASNWDTVNLPFNDISEDIDLSKITHLRFECDYIGESDKKIDLFLDVTVYIKDIQILKEV